MEEQKHIIVTGATSGIGEVTATELAKAGHRVIIIGRNEGKCQATAAKIKNDTGKKIDYLLADFSSIESTKAVAQAYLDKYSRLDILINNAGAIFGTRSDINGIEKHIVVNHLAPFVLTNELLPLLTQSAESSGKNSRIVNVSSDAHYTGIHWEDVQFDNSFPRRGVAAYGQSKAMNVLFMLELAKRIDGSGVTVNALHPGVVDTGIFTGLNLPKILMLMTRPISRMFMTTPEEGAKTTLMLAQSTELEETNGKYYSVLEEKRPLRDLRDEAEWAKMWELTEQWVEQASIVS